MQKLIMNKTGTYRSGEMEYWIHDLSPTSLNHKEIPEEIPLKNFLGYLGFAKYSMSKKEDFALSLDMFYPLEVNERLKTGGLGSFILSQTFLEFYEDSKKSRIISPMTKILVDNPRSKLAALLKNRGFKEEGSICKSTIKDAAKSSEEILSKRNWIYYSANRWNETSSSQFPNLLTVE